MSGTTHSESDALLNGKSYQTLKVEHLEGQDENQPLSLGAYSSSGKKTRLIAFLTGAAALGCSAFALSSLKSAPRAKTPLTSFKDSLVSSDLDKMVNFPMLKMSSCTDKPGWEDSFNDGCDWYENRDAPGCPRFGAGFDAGKGTAQKNCCYCGGGIISTSPPSPNPTPDITTSPPSPSPTPDPSVVTCPNGETFKITLINTGTNTRYDAAFASAKTRWESIIKCGLADVPPQNNDWFAGRLSKPYNGPVDDLVIGYEFISIDGRFNILGQASKIYQRTATGSPISGIMQFDVADFDAMPSRDAEIIILHEMGHVLNLVNIPGSKCRTSCTPGSTLYTCPKAKAEYAKLNLNVGPLKINTKNPEPGVFTCAHWFEDSFPRSTGSNELMTPFFEADVEQPITRVTVAALDEACDDYVVDYSAADPYPLTAASSNFNAMRPTSTFTIEADDTNGDGMGRRLSLKYHNDLDKEPME